MTSARLQAFDSDSEGDEEVPAVSSAAADGQPTSTVRRLPAQDGPIAPAVVQPHAGSSDHEIPAADESDDEAHPPDSLPNASDHGRGVNTSAEGDDSSEEVEPAAAAEADPQPVEDDSGDSSSDEGAEVQEPNLVHATQTVREADDSAGSDSNEELEQQQGHAAGRLSGVTDGSDSDGTASAAADSDAASGDSDEGGRGAEQEQDDAATPPTGRRSSSVEPEGDVKAAAVSADEQGEVEQLTHEQRGPAIPAGDPAADECDL